MEKKNSRVTKEERLKKGEDYLCTSHLFEFQICVVSVVVYKCIHILRYVQR